MKEVYSRAFVQGAFRALLDIEPDRNNLVTFSKRLSRGLPVPDFLTEVLTRRFIGHCDVAQNGVVGGWAIDTAHPMSRVSVLIKTRTFTAVTLACNFRHDLLTTLGQDGCHGFRLSVGPSISDGEELECWVANATCMLGNSPTCMRGQGADTLEFTADGISKMQARALIEAAFRALLGRNAEGKDLIAFTNQLRDGLTISSLLHELVTSEEFHLRSSNRERARLLEVEDVYHIVEAALIDKLVSLGIRLQLTQASSKVPDALLDQNLLRYAVHTIASNG
jgi:hypothetical protein